MTKIHLISGDSKRGIKREYVEVDCNAKVGDYAWLIHMEAVIKVTEYNVDDTNSQIIRGFTKALAPKNEKESK